MIFPLEFNQESLRTVLLLNEMPASLSSLFPLSKSTVCTANLPFFSGEERRSRFCSHEVRRFKSQSFRPIFCSSDTNSAPSGENSSSFCIIQGPETVENFVQMQLQELEDNIRSRRNKIFFLMEEVRRLRIQERIRSAESNNGSSYLNEMPDMPSSIPFLPNMTPKTMKQLHLTSFTLVSSIIMFGGLLAPILELKLGLGGTSYEDFIQNMNLPLQLSQVDPIIASFSGGAVGVISALMLIEANNYEQQQKKRCKYCHGTGYLACARCSACGSWVSTLPVSVSGVNGDLLQPPATQRCTNCSGTGKVMCPTCLCTGMMMASEHDPRIDPFD